MMGRTISIRTRRRNLAGLVSCGILATLLLAASNLPSAAATRQLEATNANVGCSRTDAASKGQAKGTACYDKVAECKAEGEGQGDKVRCVTCEAYALKCTGGNVKCQTKKSGFKNKCKLGGFIEDVTCEGGFGGGNALYCARDCRGVTNAGSGCEGTKGLVFYNQPCNAVTDWTKGQLSADQWGDVVTKSGKNYQCLYLDGYTGSILIPGGQGKYRQKAVWLGVCLCPPMTPHPDADFSVNPFSATYCPKASTPRVVKLPALLNDEYSVVVYKLNATGQRVEAFRQKVDLSEQFLLTRCPTKKHECLPSTVDLKIPDLPCGSYEVEYIPGCGPTNPSLTAKFKFEVGVKVTSKKFNSKQNMWYYTSTCGGGRVSPNQVTPNTATCKAVFKFPDAKDVCGQPIPFDNTTVAFTANWAAPVAPKGDVCPDTDFNLSAISVASISPNSVSNITLTYVVAGRKYVSGATPKPQRMSRYCGPVSFKYIPTCTKQRFTVAVNVSDSEPVFSKPSPPSYEVTYTTRCISSGGPVKPIGATSTDKGTCMASFTYPNVTNKCGKPSFTPEPVKIPFTVNWTEPAQPKGPWCPGETVKLLPISVVPGSIKVKGSNAALNSSLTPTLGYTVQVTGSGNDLTLNASNLNFSMPAISAGMIGCKPVKVEYMPECADSIPKPFELSASDEYISDCGGHYNTRCLKNADVIFGGEKYENCTLSVNRFMKTACHNAPLPLNATKFNVCACPTTGVATLGEP